jgi:FtsH-binding integral membrane protein
MQPERTQSAYQTRTTTFDPGLREFFRRVYTTMTGGLIVTGAIAWLISNSPSTMHMLFGNQLTAWAIMLSPIAFSLYLNTGAARRMSLPALTGTFYLFSATLGLSLSMIFLAYTAESITRVFFITAIMFAGMSIFGYTTKKDLSGMGSLMIMGMWGVFVAFMVNIFFHSSMIMFVASVIGVIVYTGLVGWNTQALKQTYSANNGYDANARIATLGALNLYLDFINIFMMLLRLTGGRR